MFLVNSRHRQLPATCRSFRRKALHHSRHPFSRSYGVNLPSSLARVTPRALADFCPPTCVGLRYGHLDFIGHEAISWQPGPSSFPKAQGFRLLTPPHPPDGDLPPPIIGLQVWRANHTAPEPFPSASPLGLHPGGGGILTPLPIPYAFRPQVRGRLTLGGRPFPRKPWAYGGRDSHPPYRVLVPGFSPPGPPASLVGLPSSATGVLPYHLEPTDSKSAASVPGLSPE